VGAWLAAARIAQPAPDERAALHYVVVAALGYGHLLGATQLGREGSPGRAPAVVTRLAPVLLVASFAPLYAALVARSPGLVIAALAASVWHTVENDLALPAALRTGPRLGPLAWSLRVQLPALAAAALTGAAGALALAGRLPLAFGDVFAAAMLHHLVSWLLVLRARQRALATSSPAAGRRLGRRLLALHAPPALAAGALLAAPEAPVGRLLALFFAPSLYLFFAAAHVGATALARVRPSLERSS
jgi:hypothetical protein